MSDKHTIFADCGLRTGRLSNVSNALPCQTYHVLLLLEALLPVVRILPSVVCVTLRPFASALTTLFCAMRRPSFMLIWILMVNFKKKQDNIRNFEVLLIVLNRKIELIKLFADLFLLNDAKAMVHTALTSDSLLNEVHARRLSHLSIPF
jgi:hypothetical protein